MFSIAISFVSIGRFVADSKNSDYTDILTLMAAAVANIATALNSFNLDFIKSDGTVAPYYGMAWTYGIFLALFLLCAGFVMVAIIVVFRKLRVDKMYPPLGLGR